MHILILCTGNSCRSQMAEAYLKSLDPRLEVRSAGTSPASRVHPKAVAAMKEIGIELSVARPKPVEGFLRQAFTYVITVCDNAKETCPVFTGSVKHRLHIGFDDPADLVSERQRQLLRRANPVVVKAQVGMAYAARRHPDEHFAAPRLRDGDGLHLEWRSGGREHRRLHRPRHVRASLLGERESFFLVEHVGTILY